MNDLISAAYSERLRRVCDHIERHLDEPLSIEALSRMAHSSPFHFHRQFTTWSGLPALSLYPVVAFAPRVMAAGV